MEDMDLHPICASSLHNWLAGTLDYADPDKLFVYMCGITDSSKLQWAEQLVASVEYSTSPWAFGLIATEVLIGSMLLYIGFHPIKEGRVYVKR